MHTIPSEFTNLFPSLTDEIETKSFDISKKYHNLAKELKYQHVEFVNIIPKKSIFTKGSLLFTEKSDVFNNRHNGSISGKACGAEMEDGFFLERKVTTLTLDDLGEYVFYIPADHIMILNDHIEIEKRCLYKILSGMKKENYRENVSYVISHQIMIMKNNKIYNMATPMFSNNSTNLLGASNNNLEMETLDFSYLEEIYNNSKVEDLVKPFTFVK